MRVSWYSPFDDVRGIGLRGICAGSSTTLQFIPGGRNPPGVPAAPENPRRGQAFLSCSIRADRPTMPATLHFSNALEALADRLIENIRAQGQDPFVTASIATPASAMRDWLKVRVAEKMSIAVNIAFPHLENLLWERLAERDPGREVAGRQPARLLDTFSFQGLVLARLRRDPPVALRAYLATAQPEDAARRLCQLAGQLASLFREYEYNRVSEGGYAGLAKSWMQGDPSFERHLLRGSASHPARAHLAEVRALEAWQMDIYESLFRTGGLRDEWGESAKLYRYTLPQYAQMVLESNPVAPVDPGSAQPTYHLFGLSNISPFHRDLIGQLADSSKLGAGAARFEIYALNPCAEYWEDLLTLRERRARGKRRLTPGVVAPERIAATRPDEAELAAGELREADDENGLLALFGKPGRETIKLWCQLTEYDFNEDFREAPGESLLASVRNAVLHRAGALETRVAPDPTLRFRQSANLRAELEAVRGEISEALSADSTLRPEDLAIIPADPAAVLPLLRAVFAGDDRAPGNVPILLPEGGAAEEGPVLRGFRALLTLGTGAFSRESVLNLIENPAIRSAAGLENVNAGVVRTLLEAAGFSRGNEAHEDLSDGSASLGGAFERAVLSYALDGDDPNLGEKNGLPQSVPGFTGRLDREETGALLDWLDALRTRLRPLHDQISRTYPEWARLLRDLHEAFLDPSASRNKGDRDGRNARDALDLRRFFDEMESWGSWDASEHETADATLIAMLFADRFRGAEGAGRAVFLRGGVRTGNLAALRGIPFRRVWITGLTSDFPSNGDAMPLDLRAFRRLPGESDPTARDLYALLEVLVSCTDSVSLSWSLRGADGRDQQPSRALSGLMTWLESDMIPAGVPFDFTDFAATPMPPPLRVAQASVTFSEETSAKPVHKFRDVGRFLRNPVLHATGRIFRSDDREALDDHEAELSEDLFVDKWQGKDLLDACLRAEMRNPGSAVETFDRLWNRRRRGGHTPPPPWDGLEKKRLREALENQVLLEAASLRAILDATGLRFAGALRLGPQGAERPDPPVLNVSAFDLSPLGEAFQLGGVLPWYFHGRTGWAMFADPDRNLDAYLLPLCLAALTPLPPDLATAFPGRGRLFIRTADGGEIIEQPLPDWDPEAARTVLGDLIHDYVRALRGEGHLDDVPLDTIERILGEHGGDGDSEPDWAETIGALRRHAEEAGRERLNTAERMRRAVDPSVPPDLADIIRRRLLPYMNWKTELDPRREAVVNEENGDPE
jgi:exonuclease V gamma subunit